MTIDAQTRKLAAIAYGESSGANDPNEIGAIAWAVANRARAWGGKTIEEMLTADPNYTYVVKDGSPRYNRLMKASEADIQADTGMALALKFALSALANTGADPSNGAYWWDGLDFKTNYARHPKVREGFHFVAPEHNIYDVKETSHETTIYWKVRDKKTGKEVNSKVRGKFKYVWESTAAYGGTILWKHDADYVLATGGKAYR